MIFMTRDQMREYDRIAIEDYSVPGLILMENAGRGAADVVEQYSGPMGRVAIVCGGGNNGGDGFVIARHLANRGAWVTVHLVADREKLTGDAGVNMNIFEQMGGEILDCAAEGSLAERCTQLDSMSVIVDALLGTGLTSDVRGPIAEAIEILNNAVPPKVAVDIPSGISADSGQILGAAVQAVATATFAHLKRGLLLFPGADHAGSVHVVDIGAPAQATEQAGFDGLMLSEGDLMMMITPRRADASKEEFGHLMVMAGSQGRTGAALLCAEAAMRAGTGEVTVVSTLEGQRMIETQTREVQADHILERSDSPLSERAIRKLHALVEGKQAIAVGPGCSTHPAAASVVTRLFSESELPIVVDADALEILAADPGSARDINAPLVLTPNARAMARLANLELERVLADRVGVARAQAERFNAVVVLKGAHTVISAPDGRLFINPTGNPGMACAGVGDTLTGLIGAFLAQGYPPLDAACLGVYLHGLAADHAAGEQGERGLVASDITNLIPTILRSWEAGQSMVLP